MIYEPNRTLISRLIAARSSDPMKNISRKEKVSGTFVDPASPDHVFSANWDDLFAPPGAV
jgi:hypothetical protein